MRRKPGIGYYNSNSKEKEGKQSIQNRLAFMDELQDEWTLDLKSGDADKTLLKKTYK